MLVASTLNFNYLETQKLHLVPLMSVGRRPRTPAQTGAGGNYSCTVLEFPALLFSRDLYMDFIPRFFQVLPKTLTETEPQGNSFPQGLPALEPTKNSIIQEGPTFFLVLWSDPAALERRDQRKPTESIPSFQCHSIPPSTDTTKLQWERVIQVLPNIKTS